MGLLEIIYIAILSQPLMTQSKKVVVDTNLISSLCHVEMDPLYKGILVNCQHKGISSLPLPDGWISQGTTSLLLDHNDITKLTRGSFPWSGNWTRLRHLGLSHNKIFHIEASTFSLLNSLDMLDLSFNQICLNKTMFSGREFQGLSNLRELDLKRNNNKGIQGKYSEFLFEHTPNLVTLSLDTFHQALHFGSIFNSTHKLKNLTLTGGMTVITNDSFNGFNTIKLKKLIIWHTMSLYTTGTGAFRYLEHLDWYILSQTVQDVATSFESLAPFINRKMSGIIFENLNYNYRLVKLFAGNSIVTRKMARHLTKICVEEFALRNSNVFLLEDGIFSMPELRRCLKALDLAYNPLNDVIMQFWTLSFSVNLEYLKMLDGKYFGAYYKSTVWQPPVCPHEMQSSQLDVKQPWGDHFSIRNNHHRNQMATSKRTDIFKISHNTTYNRVFSQNLRKRSQETGSEKPDLSDSLSPFRYRVYSFPRSLKISITSSISYNGNDFQSPVKIIGGYNIEEIHASDNGIRNFIGPVTGFSKVKLYDISRNNGTVMSPFFFDTLSTIVHLNMANMGLGIPFMAKHSKRLFDNLHQLRSLDLSNNELRSLAHGTFASNTKLSVLILAGNKFESIPFGLHHKPDLCWLDLRYNSLRFLSVKETNEIDVHFEISKSFSLSLKGNEFYCGCINIRFLSWLKRTTVNLDNNRNYSCVLESGQLTTTRQIENLDALWRHCHGLQAFLISLVLVCLFILGLLCCLLIPKFKTQILHLLLKLFRYPFGIKPPAAYPIGVCICYADGDASLACHRIRPFIEEKLNLTTYVRHRDLLPSSDMAQSISDVILSSWRVLLVVSKNFLNDHWSYFIMRASINAVNVQNPRRVVLILIDGDDQQPIMSKLPSCVFQTVQEESIVRMTPQGNVSYEDKQALKTALLYHGSFLDE